MTIRDVQPSAPAQHFDIPATPTEINGGAASASASATGYPLGEPEIYVGPTAYGTPIHDEHANVPIIHATSLPLGGGSGGPIPQVVVEEVPPYYYNNNSNPSPSRPIAVVTGPPQPPRVAVVTAPQPPTRPPTNNYYSNGANRSDGERCCIVTAWVAGGICCLFCVLPFIIGMFVIAFSDFDGENEPETMTVAGLRW
jgi:hypothetical protein